MNKRIPLVQEDVGKTMREPDRQSEEDPASVAQEERVNILLVDDEPKNLTVLETILNNPGYRLVRADTADQALLALVSEEFALMILDINLPGMSGFELAHMIKQRKKTAGIPIIFLTAYYSEDQHVLEGYETGAVDYLHKPVNATIMRSKVAVFVELHRRTRETALANQALFDEVVERRRIQEELVELNADLECRVRDRTSELLQANAALRASTEALQEADRRKDEFLAMLGHELRNPLAPIVNSLQILKLPTADPAILQRTRDIVERQVQHLVRLVDDLLDVSRVMRGKVELRREPIEAAAVIGRAIETVQPVIDAQGHHLELNVAAESMLLHVDPLRVAQIIGNLLTNAAKYTEEGGTLRLIARREEQAAVIEVCDNGIGIAPDMLQSVFDLFVQVDHSATRAQGGLGIGLTRVKSLVEMHGGEVTATSDGLGRGSSFVVRLPLAMDRHASHGPSEPAVSWPTATTYRILVVDDNVDAATSLAALLELQGHAVQMAHDGFAALEILGGFRPDLVFLDLGMPGIDGCEVARRIRKIPALQQTMLVALTGWGQEEDRRRTAEAGFDCHLVKPPELKAIAKVIASLGVPRNGNP